MVSHIKNPISVQLRDDQVRVLEALSEQTGDSVDVLIRRGIDTLIHDIPSIEAPLGSDTDITPDTDPDYNPFDEIIGMVAYDTGATTDDHDRHIVEMIEEESR
jgi:hypothetical protein